MSDDSGRWPGEGPGDPHASPLRDLIGDATGAGYTSYASLADARADPDGAVILEGDDGGQIYVTAPARRVACSEGALEQLLRDLDAICWPGQPDMAHLVFERMPVGKRVAGGMGGGRLIDGTWVHDRLDQLGLAAEIRAVISGAAERLSPESRNLRT